MDFSPQNSGSNGSFFGTRSVKLMLKHPLLFHWQFGHFRCGRFFVDGEEVVVKQNERFFGCFSSRGHHVISASLHPPRVRQWGYY